MLLCGGVVSSLLFLKFLPAALALFNGEAHAASHIVPIGA